MGAWRPKHACTASSGAAPTRQPTAHQAPKAQRDRERLQPGEPSPKAAQRAVRPFFYPTGPLPRLDSGPTLAYFPIVVSTHALRLLTGRAESNDFRNSTVSNGERLKWRFVPWETASS